MTRFLECSACGFVLQAVNPTSTEPKHWDACPDCGGSDFSIPGQ